MRRHGHSLNRTIVTEALWRERPAGLRLVLRRVLKRKSAIVGRQVLDIAQALCERGAYGLAFDLYQVLDGQPLIPYQGCGFGLMMNLKELMGERAPIRRGRSSCARGPARRISRKAPSFPDT